MVVRHILAAVVQGVESNRSLPVQTPQTTSSVIRVYFASLFSLHMSRGAGGRCYALVARVATPRPLRLEHRVTSSSGGLHRATLQAGDGPPLPRRLHVPCRARMIRSVQRQACRGAKESRPHVTMALPRAHLGAGRREGRTG